MKLTFLGVNGWYSDKNGNTVSVLLETEDDYIVFDAGDGLNKLDNYIKTKKPISIFLSHMHLDHIIGFHSFIKRKIENEIRIFCPDGLKKYLEIIIDKPFTNPIQNLPCKISIIELKKGTHKLPFLLECAQILHIDKTFGYSVYVEGKKITYLCDTGLCDNAKILAKDADVIIHECSMKNGISNNIWGHASSVGAAMVAKEANAKKLILTHLNSFEFPKEEDKENALLRAREVFENTIIAKEDAPMEI